MGLNKRECGGEIGTSCNFKLRVLGKTYLLKTVNVVAT
jgi:hypothetical protein